MPSQSKQHSVLLAQGCQRIVPLSPTDPPATCYGFPNVAQYSRPVTVLVCTGQTQISCGLSPAQSCSFSEAQQFQHPGVQHGWSLRGV